MHAITEGGIILRYDGENAVSAPAGRLEQYTPSVGERVLALRNIGGTVVLGKIAME